MAFLEIEYQAAHGWVYPILQAINQTPSLSSSHKKWKHHRLSDLAFAIETRLVCFPEIVAYIEENLEILGAELSSACTIDTHISGGFAFRFRNRHALRRILVGVSSFITESRSCFENLAEFYRQFLGHFAESVSKKTSYEAVARMSHKSKWAMDLQKIRHDLLHDRSLWLAFEVKPQSPRYEPVFLLNWRPGSFKSKDCIRLQTIRKIHSGLSAALTGLRSDLIHRVRRV